MFPVQMTNLRHLKTHNYAKMPFLSSIKHS